MKSDIILFLPKSSEYSKTPSVPWGLLYVSSFLIEGGYNVRLIDENVCSNWGDVVLKEIKKNSTIIFGVSSMTGMQIKHGLIFSKFVKENSNVPIVWGGIHPSILPKQTLENKYVDFVIKGEGEETLLELVKALEKGFDFNNIKGLGYKKEGKFYLNEDRPLINLNDIPDIPYNLIDFNKYVQKRYGAKRSFEMCTSRGCPHSCQFCYNQNFTKCRWRTLKTDKIFDNLHEMIHKYKIDGINWREDNFFVNQQRVREIARRIIKERIDIKWQGECRIDYLYHYSQEFLSLIKKSGCHTLTCGIESGSDKVLRNISKGITREQTLKVKDKLIDNGIHQNYHFMMGFPEETKGDINQTIDLIYKLAINNKYLSNIFGPSAYTPYPGTKLYEKSLEMGFQPPTALEGWIGIDWDKINLPWFTNKKKRRMENISWNIRGLCEKLPMPVRKYFLFKLFLLAKCSINLPNFEKYIYGYYRKLTQMKKQ